MEIATLTHTHSAENDNNVNGMKKGEITKCKTVLNGLVCWHYKNSGHRP